MRSKRQKRTWVVQVYPKLLVRWGWTKREGGESRFQGVQDEQIQGTSPRKDLSHWRRKRISRDFVRRLRAAILRERTGVDSLTREIQRWQTRFRALRRSCCTGSSWRRSWGWRWRREADVSVQISCEKAQGPELRWHGLVSWLGSERRSWHGRDQENRDIEKKGQDESDKSASTVHPCTNGRSIRRRSLSRGSKMCWRSCAMKNVSDAWQDPELDAADTKKRLHTTRSWQACDIDDKRATTLNSYMGSDGFARLNQGPRACWPESCAARVKCGVVETKSNPALARGLDDGDPALASQTRRAKRNAFHMRRVTVQGEHWCNKVALQDEAFQQTLSEVFQQNEAVAVDIIVKPIPLTRIMMSAFFPNVSHLHTRSSSTMTAWPSKTYLRSGRITSRSYTLTRIKDVSCTKNASS